MQRIFLGIILSGTALSVTAQEHEHSHAQAITPLAIMGSHLHQRGEWMFSYQYMNMDMEGNRTGTNRVSTQDIFNAGYTVAPLSMSMQMHMFGAMYGVTDTVSMMLMAPYLVSEMDHVTVMNVPFTTSSEGWGDIKLTTSIGLVNEHATQLLINAGISLPTGSIDERDNTPMMANAKLPYPMQLGSGTYDMLFGATYIARAASWSWGAQGLAIVRTGTNDNNYTLGNRIDITGWLARAFTDAQSGSIRLLYADWQNIDGSDPELNPMMVPTADPNLRAGSRADIAVGYRFSIHAHNLGFEYSLPIYQDLEGPQLETESILSVNWQYSL